ncbi:MULTISPECIES: glycogen/starch/alpha-glucan phosphorylase [Bacillus cereus group]|uniref:Alpha-1,4 glucan phosphorylase n=1 Tax=Bacillus cytotoxicus (strain DSM 22905 / CIP 110041 / 391-98 / NVH 391-98) TaxID=315749 RepID=A7GU97_BACCN|nr:MULTISPECIES: glycogen/starch/alpha-glucan phosphorylase [Bacillus cereus group]ABS23705.1 glycogen/starch/alpha-glucan phosphorylase [Bacillus cytotoxicus NVH 391-98]AWC46318.1 glycogen/starch/alpha-glucan phosphorylase [Bacillus cytotoxicus]MDH2866357.1 glycogen/starch/alpha-glucan phosphorylase [Bacillus cytotoxicus]MDH2886197.1 glycogen/starch/alpha-glucan phosphorylase [Bacillus cytotoxicus]MDH2889250.1 glycogen/starch/alpha-glucan phosphorylase [Bacillus cytotoxicus]
MFTHVESFKAAFLEKLETMYGKSFKESTSRDQYNTLGHMVREYMNQQWIATNEKYRTANQKQVYYLSIEFLLGRLLGSNMLNLGIRNICEQGLKELGISLKELEESEADAGLGNGGLGRLAACFLDSLASLNLPGHGCGIRYKHGLFDQKIVDGYQVELPEQWLLHENVWEVRRYDQAVEVSYFGHVEPIKQNGRLEFRHTGAEVIMAVPYDVPVVGYETDTVNTLRLWNAEPVPFPQHCKDVLKYKRDTEVVSEFLYPDDTHDEGKILRLKQQYFLVSASLQNIIRMHRERNGTLQNLHEKIAIHINDTHPVLAIPELMRILLDEEKLSWEEAWYITTHTISYTNHTTLSEALEKWPVHIFKPLLPRIYMIIEEINERFCHELWERYPYEWKRIEDMAIIAHDLVKMAHLAIVGSYSINGVAKIHTEILKRREMRLFYEFYPEKFNNKTNGITHRRWLMKANPELTTLISEVIGTGWKKEPIRLEALQSFKNNTVFQEKLHAVKQKRKNILAERIQNKMGILIDPHSIFDVQVKRLHAYKRQLLNVLHILYLYNRLKEDSSFSFYPRTFIFGAKASPGYYYAKKIIKLINELARKVNDDPYVSQYMKVIFLENYRVSLAEDIFPAADVSEQISTASKEASGTGNMKFMMNGAITIGTLDGANIEIRDRVGDEACFIFGLTAEEVLHYYQNGGYRANDYYHHNRHIKKVVNQLTNGFFAKAGAEFEVIYDSLIIQNDEYFVLRDFSPYAERQEEVGKAYENRRKWLEMSIMNIAQSGHFASDRTILQYSKEIWGIGDQVKQS